MAFSAGQYAGHFEMKEKNMQAERIFIIVEHRLKVMRSFFNEHSTDRKLYARVSRMGPLVPVLEIKRRRGFFRFSERAAFVFPRVAGGWVAGGNDNAYDALLSVSATRQPGTNISLEKLIPEMIRHAGVEFGRFHYIDVLKPAQNDIVIINPSYAIAYGCTND